MKTIATAIVGCFLACYSVLVSATDDSSQGLHAHDIEILVISDAVPLAPDIPSPDYDGAASLEDAYRMRAAHDEEVEAAQKDALPLTAGLTLESTKWSLVNRIRDALLGGGLRVHGIRFQVVADVVLAGRKIEDRTASAPHGSDLLVLVPRLLLSPDGRTLTASVDIRVYRRGSEFAVVDKTFAVLKSAKAADKPIDYWVANDATAFSAAMMQSGDELGQDVLRLIGK
jgi:hypothetical protein